ncbi:hypothetical protein [Anaerococcus tetradius]|uniref:Uncharacterized protein n=1 Tax=Anaerococcus tetradius TaxID=33036 RepID=A0A133KI18_9FIRM|nr:hypothetical protein [Anaerococcus tetradius]KWZ79074.1 hypothetical protein HMPREF3200_00321 [Anaerococcus tetradius]
MKNKIRLIKDSLNRDLFYNIHESCIECEYSDCKGIIHIIESEVDDLVDIGAEIVCLNDNINLLNTFDNDESGNIDLTQQSPTCKLRDSKGNCKIQKNKPLFCMLFPFMIVNYLDGKNYWALSKKCSYYDYLVSNSKVEDTIENFINYLEEIPSKIYNEITSAFIKTKEVVHYIYSDEEVEIIKEI